MTVTLKNPTAMVTGAASGIGQALPLAVARVGVKAAGVGIQEDASNDTTRSNAFSSLVSGQLYRFPSLDEQGSCD